MIDDRVVALARALLAELERQAHSDEPPYRHRTIWVDPDLYGLGEVVIDGGVDLEALAQAALAWMEEHADEG